MVTCRELNPEIEFKFFKAVQNAFYSDNLNTNKSETYIKLAKQFSLDETKFKTMFESEELIQKTKEEFALASQMGVSGFPAVIISKNGKLHLVCKGYMKAEQVIKNINKVIQ